MEVSRHRPGGGKENCIFIITHVFMKKSSRNGTYTYICMYVMSVNNMKTQNRVLKSYEKCAKIVFISESGKFLKSVKKGIINCIKVHDKIIA